MQPTLPSLAMAPMRMHKRHGCLRGFGAQAAAPSLRIVCFPWCGASASGYRMLAANLPGNVELLSVQLPGREDRMGEPKLLRMQDVVAQALPDIVCVYDRPLVLFGHSLGALIAYEVAQELRRRIGREPHALIVSGHAAPDFTPSNATRWHDADEAALLAQLRALGGTPAPILEDPKMMEILLPVLRADYQIVETYAHQPKPPFSCPLLVCAADKDAEVSPVGVEAWRNHTAGLHRLHWYSGDHFYLCTQPQAFAKSLYEFLAML